MFVATLQNRTTKKGDSIVYSQNYTSITNIEFQNILIIFQKGTLHPLVVIPLYAQLLATTNLFLSLWICLFWMFHIIRIIYGLLCLGFQLVSCFWGSFMFSWVAAPFFNPTSNLWGFQFFHIIANSCYLLSFLLQSY